MLNSTRPEVTSINCTWFPLLTGVMDDWTVAPTPIATSYAGKSHHTHVVTHSGLLRVDTSLPELPPGCSDPFS